MWFRKLFYLLWKFHCTLHYFYLTFFEVWFRIYRLENLHKNWQHFNFEEQGILDGVCLPEIFTSEPNLCLKVYDGNSGDMLTSKLAGQTKGKLWVAVISTPDTMKAYFC